MPRRPLAHERIRTELTQAATLAETPAEFGAAVLAILQGAIGCDGGTDGDSERDVGERDRQHLEDAGSCRTAPARARRRWRRVSADLHGDLRIDGATTPWPCPGQRAPLAASVLEARVETDLHESARSTTKPGMQTRRSPVATTVKETT